MQEEGKSICPSCEGKGHYTDYPDQLCDRCQGDGELDWVEMIMGKKRRLNAYFSQELVDELVEALKAEIDNEIVKSIIVESNKI